jgi:glycogen operon protein
MSDEDWQAGFAKSLGVFLNGDAIPTPNERGERIVDDSFYVVFNAHHEPLSFTLPGKQYGATWGVVLDTRQDDVRYMREDDIGRIYNAGESFEAEAWSLVLLRRTAR